ncbi:MAG: ferrous iron transport protein B [Planctomycetota bacterium]|nr:MAG: ferrous iron transport protein B [Planctomycetota bacterium]REJ86662.1 MAG: ferrous iron transport protein B [Planctomycetota bacterium]REK27165.1 MAG: ferrous iron transport protein B [Planctomycetota bacterium]REK37838.1 MAG: ferrous iron transport protein B [Planctomycetota bacterium]
MSLSIEQATRTIALVGNPNTGKSTLFNALCGVRQRVGNYPGVTVEKKVGHVRGKHRTLELIDLPGTYSLAPHSPDEMVTVDVLLGRRTDAASPDAVLAIVDAANLERNLYLVSQLLELDKPVVVALNMMDVAREREVEVDVSRLADQLGVPVIPLEAHRKVGLAELRAVLDDIESLPSRTASSPFPALFQETVAELNVALSANGEADAKIGRELPRFLVERLLLDTGGYLEGHLLADADPQHRASLVAARDTLANAGMPVPGIEAVSRYRWAGEVTRDAVRQPRARAATLTDRIDQVLTHWVAGTLIFVLLMLVVFTSIFTFAPVPMGWIESLFELAGDFVSARLADGALKSLLVDGVLAGLGGVVVFLPQILVLFFFIALLEDCGYMARAAYLMDKLMSRVGLSGKSFIPLLSSFACAVPGIMAARVIENPRDRMVTILVAPLMSCSARLPVYIILVSAFIPATTYLGGLLSLQVLVFFAMYLLGIVVAAAVAWLLKKTLFRGETPPFVMELPSYKWPSPGTVVFRMLDRGWAFLRRAGTIIFAVAIVVWALLYFPRNEAEVKAEAARQLADPAVAALLADVPEEERLENLEKSLHQRQSLLGRAGQAIEPVVRPLGWDWRIGSAAIASFPAREVVMGVLGVIYRLGEDIDVGEEEDQTRLGAQLKAATWDGTARPVYNVPVALSLMVFFALCAQCAATLAVLKRETNSWRWPIFAFVYMTALAYVGALITYQVGMLFVA